MISYDTDDSTILLGSIVDQAALHGLLIRVRDLSLTLLSVNLLSLKLGSNPCGKATFPQRSRSFPLSSHVPAYPLGEEYLALGVARRPLHRRAPFCIGLLVWRFGSPFLGEYV